MALDPEELKRQRQQRQQQRQEKAARTKALWIRLGIAGAVLLGCGLLIFFLARGNSQSPDIQNPPSQSQPDASVSSEATQQAPTTTIHFAAAGDLNVTSSTVAAGGGSYDYTQTFMDVAHLLADADLTALNFEGNLCGAPYGQGLAPQELADALAAAGVDVVQLANSYSIHKGLSGLSDTIDGIRAAGMEPLGVYASPAEFRQGKGFTIRNVQGIRVAMVAFTKGMDGMALPENGENCVNVLYTDYDSTYQTVDTEGISAVLDAVAQEKPDITIAMLHWGSEFNNTISKSQTAIVSLMQEKGVDAIIGTHSHYVQQMTLDPETGNFVAYSLGDFFGDASRSGSEYSVILDLEITKDNQTGDTKITNYTYTPTFTVVQKDEPLRVMRIRETMAAYEGGYIEAVSPETYSAMQYALSRIETRVAGE